MGGTISQALIAHIGATHVGLRRELNAAVRMARGAGSRFRSAFSVASRAAAELTVAVGAVGGAALKMASDFERGMAEVSTLLDVTLDQMGELSAAVKDLSLRFGVGLTDQARALYQAISAGAAESADATRILEVANKAAVAGITDVATSVEAITRVINAYSLDASEAMRVSDVLFQIVRKGVTTFSELAPTIGRVAGTAAAAGVSFEEMAAIIATATKRLPIEEVITGANQLLISFASRTKQTEEAARALEIQWDASAVAAKGVGGVLGDLLDALKLPVSELQKIVDAGGDTAATLDRIANRAGVSTEIISALFPNVRALRVALALVANQGQEFRDQLDNMNEAGGTTEEAYKKMAATFGFLARRVKQEVLVAFVELGETLFPVAREVAGGIGRIARATRDWIAANRDLLQQRVQQIFTAIVRGAGKVAEQLIGIVEFFTSHPIAGEFGLVGLVFLGPTGAAALTFIGALIDQLLLKLFGPTEVADRLRANIEDAQAEMRKLQNELAFTRPTKDRLAEIVTEMNEWRSVIEMNQRTLDRFGPEVEGTLDAILEKAKEFARAMQEFDFGDLFGGFAEEGVGEEEQTPAAQLAGNLDDVFKILREIPGLLQEIEGPMENTSRFAHDWAEASEDAANTITSRVVGALTDVFTRVKNITDGMKAIGQAILREVVGALVKAVAQAFILKAVLSAFGLPVSAFRSGGTLRRAQAGLLLPSFAPPGFGGAIPIMAHPGEAVLTRRTVQALGGGQAITRLNRGEPSRAPAMAAAPQRVEVEFKVEQVPEPADYGIIASKPQLLRLFSEMVRAARDAGVRV